MLGDVLNCGAGLGYPGWTGLFPPPRPLILGMSLPLELSYTKSITYLGKLEEHVVISATVFSLLIFT